MSNKTLKLTDELYRYLLGVSLREPEVLRRLREETRALPEADCQISPEQGQFMALLLRLIGARQVLEVGTFTGYSSTVMAFALPGDGRVTTCEHREKWVHVARRYWREAGVENRVELRLGEAGQTLDRLLDEGRAGSYDFAFIDADKENDAAYFEQCLVLVRTGGLVAVDNTLWGGHVINPARTDPETAAIRAFNDALARDERIDLSMVPIADGLTLARKR